MWYLSVYFIITIIVTIINRELAYQIAEQFRVLGKGIGLKECVIVGGMGKYIKQKKISIKKRKKERKDLLIIYVYFF